MASAKEEFDELMRDKTHRISHPEDDNDTGSFLNVSDDDDPTPSGSQHDPEAEEAPRPSISSYRSTIPTTRYQANTGVKGVIADAQHWQDSCRNQRSSFRSTQDLSVKAQALTLDTPAPRLSNLDEDAEGVLEDLDGDFMDQWRKSRIAELQNAHPRSGSQIDTRNRRLFGVLTTVDGDGFLEAVDSSQDAVVVVYIFDHQVRQEQMLVHRQSELTQISPKSAPRSSAVYEL
jgi:hypothetical protein